MCFLACKFSRKTAFKFQKYFCVTLFQKFVTDCHLEYLGLSYAWIQKKKTYLKEHFLINVQQNILPRMIERLRDATNALEQED